MIKMCSIKYAITLADQQLEEDLVSWIKHNATFFQHCVMVFASKSLWEKERHVCS